jgi:hypothetical protein
MHAIVDHVSRTRARGSPLVAKRHAASVGDALVTIDVLERGGIILAPVENPRRPGPRAG